ncbi:MAG: hypothetical protein L0G94_10215 [Brachybacterium sp.]|uniref:hypothetical protein n=1 Tax=Brachybacterium sp. TaxID=1891286 RepID=UPI0026488973|nr:hypothetical protein [Brachybacterium sp.]MDN5687028.1 hypothetical protein [Brachybacterium sp.]
MSTAHARTTDPITSHEAAAGIDPNRSQAAVLQLLQQFMGRYFTHKAVVATYDLVYTNQQQEPHPGDLPALSESRVRTACNELKRKRVIVQAGYTKPAQGRREAIWELAGEGDL